MKTTLFPTPHEALITGCIFSFLAGLVVSALCLADGLEWTDYVSSLATLAAAFSGAWLAFHLANRAQQRQEYELRSMNVNKALFVLLRQINAVEGIAQDVCKYDSNEKLAFEMPSYQPNKYGDLQHDFDGLAFLASSKYANDLFLLTIEQERFEQVLRSVEIRNEHYINHVMPEMMAAGLTDRKASLGEYQQKLKATTYKGALQGAKHMREQVELFRQSSVAMHQRFNQLAKELFPGQSFLQVAV